MSTFDDTPAVLRRRAQTLEQEEGYNPQFTSVFLRAADELVVRRRCATEAEQEAVDQLGNITVLKRSLGNIAGIVARSTMSKHDRRAVAQNLHIAGQVKPPHKARTILSIEIVPTETFEAFLDRVKELYDHHTGGATHGKDEGPAEETDPHDAGGAQARGDDAQQQRAQERDRETQAPHVGAGGSAAADAELRQADRGPAD